MLPGRIHAEISREVGSVSNYQARAAVILAGLGFSGEAGDDQTVDIWGSVSQTVKPFNSTYQHVPQISGNGAKPMAFDKFGG